MSAWRRFTGWSLAQRGLMSALGALTLALGLITAPFTGLDALLSEALRSPIYVDALPELGARQQLITTRWPGRAPEEVEEQLSYPLMTALLGTAGVQTIRSSSTIGLSSLTVIFSDEHESDWARSRLIEQLSALPEGLLPEGVQPRLGPDATPLGQIFWYALEPYDPLTGETRGGWPLDELRSIQDDLIRYALERVEGVAELSPVGGYVSEYQIEADPLLLERYGLTLQDLVRAAREAHLDVGAGVIERNGVEHLSRGVGQLESARDLERAVVATRAPLVAGGALDVITLEEVAQVMRGPARRRGALDIGGAEVVGGIVVARSGAPPLAVIKRVREAIARLTPSLPRYRGPDGEELALRFKVIYDRSELIGETLETLSSALGQQLLITLIVVIALIGRLSSALVMSSALPLALSLTFGLMWLTGVSANVMSLSGIAIAIGTMIDMGVVITERAQRRVREGLAAKRAALDPRERLKLISEAAGEVAPAITTSALTTILSFIPIFGLGDAEGRLFHPLAFTKTFALLSALLLSLSLSPVVLSYALEAQARWRALRDRLRRAPTAPARSSQRRWHKLRALLWRALLLLSALYALSLSWSVTGEGAGGGERLAWVSVLTLGALAPLAALIKLYPPSLRWALRHKALALCAPALLCLLGAMSWLGAPAIAPKALQRAFPGLGREFMPPFDEGELIYMPTLPAHASMTEALKALRALDARLEAIPEVRQAVGKLGRAESALDPAPPSMFEVLISLHPEYELNSEGARVRRWRPHIKSQDDVWEEISAAAAQPGLTGSPKLMPIQTRVVMLQSGLKAPLGLKLQARSLEALERAGRALERLLRDLEGVEPSAVFAERPEGKPRLELKLDRDRLAEHGLTVAETQRSFQLATEGVEALVMTRGRARESVVVKASRAYREELELLRALPIPTARGESVPLHELGVIEFRRGPQMIKGEGGALVSYVTFAPQLSAQGAPPLAEGDLMRRVLEAIEAARSAPQGELALALHGVELSPEGSYLNQLRSEARLRVLIPLALLLILLVLSLQLRSWYTIASVYAGVAVSLGGAFTLLWCYGQGWFAELSLFGVSFAELFGAGPVRLSVAVWVGVIALLGVATDDGVVMASALDDELARGAPKSVEEARDLTLRVATARLVPCLITTATTLIALLPVLTSAGRGADLMRPMALPSVGGMAVELLTLFVVPTLYCARLERALPPA